MTDQATPAFLQALGAARESDRRAGRAHLGGPFIFTWYARGYLRASRVVFDDAQTNGLVDEMAAVCLYLLRHAVELLLKDLVDHERRIHAMQHALATGVYAEPNSARGHDLQPLLAEAVSSLASLRESMPADLVTLVDEIDRFEDGDPTRSRYPRGVRAAYAHASFPQSTTIPIGGWISRLEQLVQEHFEVRSNFESRPNSEWCIAESFAVEHEAAAQALFASGQWP